MYLFKLLENLIKSFEMQSLALLRRTLDDPHVSSVEARICEMVPKRWNNIATNWMIKMRAKKNTNTRPMGSSCRYSFEMWIWKTSQGKSNNLLTVLERRINSIINNETFNNKEIFTYHFWKAYITLKKNKWRK